MISIHAPLRERPFCFETLDCKAEISIHAPLRERPQRRGLSVAKVKQFQSTLPCGSDLNKEIYAQGTAISIHAPLRERRFFMMLLTLSLLFQSTLPCGSDRSLHSLIRPMLKFQSTLPCGSDQYGDTTLLPDYISIHAPLRERL